MVTYWLETSQKLTIYFTDFEQIEDLVVILLNLDKLKKLVGVVLLWTNQKLSSYSADFEQVKNLVVVLLLWTSWTVNLSVGNFRQVFDGGFLDGCFLDGYFLDQSYFAVFFFIYDYKFTLHLT